MVPRAKTADGHLAQRCRSAGTAALDLTRALEASAARVVVGITAVRNRSKHHEGRDRSGQSGFAAAPTWACENPPHTPGRRTSCRVLLMRATLARHGPAWVISPPPAPAGRP